MRSAAISLAVSGADAATETRSCALAGNRRQGEQVARPATDNDSHRASRRGERVALGQRECLGHHGIGRVAGKERKQHHREDSRRRGCSRQPGPQPNHDPWHSGRDDAGRIAAVCERDGGPRGRTGQRCPQLHVRASVRDEAEHRHLPGQQRCMTRRPTVRDDRTSTGERLQAGNPAGRVHQHVRGSEQIAHRVDESEHPHPRLAGKRTLETHASPLIAAGEADHRHTFELERCLDGSVEITNRPAATRDDDKRPLLRQAERLPGLGCRTRSQELRRRPAARRHARCRDRRCARRPPRGSRASRGAGRHPCPPTARVRRSR